MLNVNASELGALKDTNKDEYDKIMDSILFKNFNLKLRCKIEVYNGLEHGFRCGMIPNGSSGEAIKLHKTAALWQPVHLPIYLIFLSGHTHSVGNSTDL
ncbi:hypothetical protein E2C01_034060 [Portunus trituberculatus]|uniref:Uncharacterized protein n=1 Tax=Portunus trituberculatus TaxID=210409 RepID=A0A5B7EZI7_PORTR|nr:hypothetical protein [Portunus trituberculatus]